MRRHNACCLNSSAFGPNGLWKFYFPHFVYDLFIDSGDVQKQTDGEVLRNGGLMLDQKDDLAVNGERYVVVHVHEQNEHKAAYAPATSLP